MNAVYSTAKHFSSSEQSLRNAIQLAKRRARGSTLESQKPDQIWISDIACVATAEGWLYLAVILDLFSRRVVGWKLGESLEAELVQIALQNALLQRRPPSGLIFHFDRGCQYTSQAVRAISCKALG